jgi:pimeloyl-ACP methyl ester carboxylesterase
VHEFRNGDLVFDVTDEGPADGDVVVLLHGYPENRTSWRYVIPALTAAGYRVLAPDQRGYSPRARPTGRRAYRSSELVSDVDALIDASGAERVHLVGHDWGGAVAWAYATQRWERLASMTSLTTPHPQALARSFVRSDQLRRSWYVFFYQLPLLPELSYAPVLAQRTAAALEKTGLPPEFVDSFLLLLREPGAATAAINWYRGAPLSKPLTGPVQVPTLYVYATADPFLGPVAARLTSDHVAAPYRFEELAGASHWLPEAHADDITPMLLEHFAAHPA